MTKRDLVVKIAREINLNQSQVADTVQKTLDYIAEELIAGRTIELRNFGVFEIKVRKSRKGRNPNEPKHEVVIPERAVVKFRAGKELKEAIEKLNPADFYEADKKLASDRSIDLSKYTLLEWKHVDNHHWNSTSQAAMKLSSGSTDKQFICVDKKYPLTELPIGSIFIVDAGWQYRLEKFTEENVKFSGSRPGNKTDALYVLDTGFVGDCKYLTWNVSTVNRDDISAIYAQAAAHLRIYVPKS